MYTTDPISDMLSRIRNAIMVQKTEVSVPYSKIKHQIADILVSSNYLDKAEVSGEGKDKAIEIVIHAELTPARITELKRISRPGRRVYSQSNEIPYIKNGRGMVVISTSKGLMTGDQARKERIGGEVLCSVY